MPGRVNANLYELLRERFADSFDEPFLVEPGGPATSYRDVDRRSAQMADVMADYGVAIGDRVVVQVPKSVDAVALYLACLRAGAIYVPLNTAYRADEVGYFLDDAEPALVITEGEIHRTSTPTTVTMDVLAGEADTAPGVDGVVPRLADDLAAMLYTSGTTGRSKGAMLSHGNLASNALTLHASWGFEPGDVLLHILPVFHVHGLFVALHTAMLNASEVRFLRRFDVDTVIDELPAATVMMGVPTHYSRLLEDTRFDEERCSNIRLFTSGSAPMTVELHGRMERRTGHEVLERYGMTETGMITSNPYRGDRIAGTVGFALPGISIRVHDEDDREVPPGAPGVVHVRGPNVFAGYWRLPDRTRAEFRDDGWFVTGDIGHLDSEGRLTLEGRSSDMIITGGLNVYPREIEQVLDVQDTVVESAVIGLPDDDLGEIVVAIVVATPEFEERSVLADLGRRLAAFKVPKRLAILDALPRNAMGKVQKAQLRERFGPSEIG